MSKDYKHRLKQAQIESQKKPGVAGWQWLLIGALVIGFAIFLFSLRGKAPQAALPPTAGTVQPIAKTPAPAEAKKTAPPATVAQTAALETHKDAQPKADDKLKLLQEKFKPVKPRFQFYTVLPEKEVIIPEAEVKARKQEEKQSKTPVPVVGEGYMLQIGSFKTMGEADRLKAQLAMLGVEAKIETAQIGAAVWNRVKVGPFASMANADKVRDQLRQSNVDSVVQRALAATPAAVAPPPPP